MRHSGTKMHVHLPWVWCGMVIYGDFNLRESSLEIGSEGWERVLENLEAN